MPNMQFQELSTNISEGKYAPIYLLMGEEPYYLDLLTRQFQEEIISEDTRDFNLTVTYGDQVSEKDIVDMCRSVPMMGDKKVIIVKEAQNLWKTKRGKNKESDSESGGFLTNYVSHPNPSSILVLCHKGKIDKRKKIYTELSKKHVVFESAKMRDYEVPNWIRSFAQKQGLKMNEKSISMIFESVGNDLNRIAHEMEKLKISLTGKDKNQEITEDFVERYVGISKEYNVFELQNALENHDTLKATKIVNNLGQKNEQFFQVISVLYGFFFRLLIYHYSDHKENDSVMASRMNINRFFLKGYQKAANWYNARKCINNISLLRRANANAVGLDSKAATSEVFRELIFKLMH